MSLLKSFAKDTVVYGLGSIFPKLLNYLFSAICLTRIVDMSDYGIHGILYGYISLVMVFVTFRMETAFFRFGSQKEDRKKVFSNTTWIVLVLTLIAFVLACTFSTSIATVLTSPLDSRYVIWFALIALFDAVATLPFAKIRIENRAKEFALLKIFNALCTILLISIFIIWYPDVFKENEVIDSRFTTPFNDLDYIFVANVISSGLVMLYLLKEYIGIEFRIDRKYIYDTLKYSSPLVIVGVAGVINNVADRYFLKELNNANGIDLEASGLYNGCVKLAVFMTLFTTAFNYGAEPFFFRNKTNKDHKSIYGKVSLAYTIVAGAIFLFITLYIDLLKFITDESYYGGLGIVPILTLAYLFLGLYYNFSIWYKLGDRTIMGAYIGVTGAVITIVGNIVLIPIIGIYGAAYTSLICFFSMAFLAYWTGRTRYPIEYPIKKMLAYISLSVIMFFAFSYITNQVELNGFKWIFAAILIAVYSLIAFVNERKTIFEF